MDARALAVGVRAVAGRCLKRPIEVVHDRKQILERIGPMRQKQAGHERPVFVYNIVAHDTVDEVVIDRMQSKREVQDLLLEYMKNRNG